MPNWVDNDLRIYGSEEELRKIKDFVTNEDGEFDFKKIIPPPDHPDYNDEPLSVIDKSPFNWYNWNWDNWGTKWNARESIVTGPEDGCLHAWFQTAWATPVPVTMALSKLFPSVRIEHRYIEEADFFCGYLHVIAGREMEDSWEDLPNHNNVEEFGRECQCYWNDDQEYWYDDCPREEATDEQRLVTAGD